MKAVLNGRRVEPGAEASGPYSEAVIARVRNPGRVGSMPANAPDVGTGEAGTFDEGTVVRIHVRVRDGRTVDARFKAFGCSAAIASAALVAEWLEGTDAAETDAVTVDAVVEALGLADERRPVAALAVEAAGRALADWRRKAAGGGSRV
jgi:nitrogen fixation NifU-like protein